MPNNFAKKICLIALFLHFSASHAELPKFKYPAMQAFEKCKAVASKSKSFCNDEDLVFFEAEFPVANAMLEKDYSKLDALYEKWCTGTDRFPDGRWMLGAYRRGLAQFGNWEGEPAELLFVENWKKQKPASSVARYAEAVYWHDAAWSARGSGYVSSISDDAWKLFKERMNKSYELLNAEYKRQGKFQCPAQYSALLDALTLLGAPEELLRKTFEEGVAMAPEFHNLYFAMARHYEPKWGGEIDRYEAFADEAARRTASFEGMGMYARLYWTVDGERDIPFKNESTLPPAWAKLRAGYDDLLRRYPLSAHNAAQYLSVACRSNDSELYRQLRSRMQGNERLLHMFDSLDACDRKHNWIAGRGAM